MGRLGNPSLIREAREAIDDLQFDSMPPGAVKMRRYNDAYRVKFGADAYRIVYRRRETARDPRGLPLAARDCLSGNSGMKRASPETRAARLDLSLEGSPVHA